MKIYAIQDDTFTKNKILGYIFYFEKDKNWYIELCDNISEWEAPFILDHFISKGELYVPFYYSKMWVEQRIVPSDRQNIGSILKEYNLEEYDEFKLFLISDGRCSQDNCYIVPVKEGNLPIEIKNRRNNHIQSATVCNETDLMISLKCGDVLILNLEKCKDDYPFVNHIMKYREKIGAFDTMSDGSEIVYGHGHSLPYSYINKMATILPFKSDALISFSEENIISTSEAMEILGCSRQNIDDLVKRGRLTPAKIKGPSKMFLKSDVRALLK